MSQRNPTEGEAAQFALMYILERDLSMAFKYVYPSSKAKDKTIHEKASRYYRLGKVQASIKVLRELFLKNLEKENIYVLEKAFDELEEARVLASTPDANGKVNPTAMISATMGKAKLAGFLEPKRNELSSQVACGVIVVPEGKTAEEQLLEYQQIPDSNTIKDYSESNE
jgi:hypothetical protein